MEIVRFTLSGRSACFKKPEMNSYCYFTYGNIHKVALLGIFGAVLGYGGYVQLQGLSQKKTRKEGLDYGFPQFYERLGELKISILPSKNYEKGYIPKKVQAFNNSVGYASQEQGGNLIVKEQWLENPSWDICLLVDSEEGEKLKTALCRQKCVYYPYLGKNEHFADIKNVQVKPAVSVEFSMGRLHCLCPKDVITLTDLDEDELEDLNGLGSFKYEEALPYELDGWTNHYKLREFVYTDAFVEAEKSPVYELGDGRKVIFY